MGLGVAVSELIFWGKDCGAADLDKAHKKGFFGGGDWFYCSLYYYPGHLKACVPGSGLRWHTEGPLKVSREDEYWRHVFNAGGA